MKPVMFAAVLVLGLSALTPAAAPIPILSNNG
jgi:hypothetical protein